MNIQSEAGPDQLTLKWHGPFSWTGKTCLSIYDCDMAEGQGIYLWTVPTSDREMIYYVGQTGTAFARRQYEHLCAYGTGSYNILDPYALARGEKRELYLGFNYRQPYWRNGREFVERASVLLPAIAGIMEVIRFWFCPIETDRRTRERIEGAIIQLLDDIAEPGIHLQDKGMHRVLRDKASESPIHIAFADVSMFRGLPQQIEA